MALGGLGLAARGAHLPALLDRGISHLSTLLPAAARLAPAERLQVLIGYQFVIYLLLVPLMIALSVTTFSIFEERRSHTLEPLLATPVRTWELLVGKALAGWLPALGLTWLCALLFVLGFSAFASRTAMTVLLGPAWFVSLLLLTPLIALLALFLGLIGSSRARDVRAAQNIGLVVVLPVLGLVLAQLLGLTLLDARRLAALAGGVAALDALALAAAVRIFRRRSIVTDWA